MICTVAICDRPVLAKGLCNAHYLRKSLGKPMDVPIKVRAKRGQVPECQAENCTRQARGGYGRCQKHYRQELWRERKQILVDLLGGECHDCHQSYPLAVYDFHHTHGGKKFAVGEKIITKSLTEVKREVLKCILLCANCHRIRHYE